MNPKIVTRKGQKTPRHEHATGTSKVLANTETHARTYMKTRNPQTAETTTRNPQIILIETGPR